MMEMPDVIYARFIPERRNNSGTWSVFEKPHCKWGPTTRTVKVDHERQKYHHYRVIEALQKENDENCRLLGMSAEREIQLLQKVQQLENQVSCLMQNSESQTQTQQALIKKLHRLLPDDLCPQDDKSWQQSDAFGRIEYLVAAYKSNRDELKMVWEWVVELKAKLAKTEWQPIETAPEGKNILVWYKGGVEVAWRYGEGWQLDTKRIESPTHWMPLPEPPTTEETKCLK